MKKKNYTAEFKAQVVLEILREEKTLSEIATEHELNPNQIRNWKREFLERAPSVFEESKAKKEAVRREKEAADEKTAMLEIIGQLTLERDFLKKKSIEQFGPDYEKKFHK